MRIQADSFYLMEWNDFFTEKHKADFSQVQAYSLIHLKLMLLNLITRAFKVVAKLEKALRFFRKLIWICT